MNEVLNFEESSDRRRASLSCQREPITRRRTTLFQEIPLVWLPKVTTSGVGTTPIPGYLRFMRPSLEFSLLNLATYYIISIS